MKDILLSQIIFFSLPQIYFLFQRGCVLDELVDKIFFEWCLSATIFRAKENRKDIFLSQLIFHRKQGFSQTKSSTKCFPGEVVDKDFQCERKTLKSTYYRHHDHECIYIICIPALPISPSFSVPKYSCVPANKKFSTSFNYLCLYSRFTTAGRLWVNR